MAAPELNVRAAAAVDDLYRRHVGDVYRYTYAVLGNHADAEDVTQTTFVNALRALERGEQPREPSNWLIVIAHNIVRQRWRQAAARPSEVELDERVAEAAAEPDVELDELVRALQRIPPAQREALVMRELEGRSYREISEMLGMSTAALETLLFRARRSLAEELENLVTCQSAELAISKRIDGRLSRKERRRLESHLAECPPCARLAETQGRQRRAFKGLAVLPIPVGLALFKGAPAASAAALPTIGVGATGTGFGATGVGAGGATAGAGAAAGAGGAAAGGTLLGGAVVKIAAVVVAGTVATGIGYEGVKVAKEYGHATPTRSSGSAAHRGAKSGGAKIVPVRARTRSGSVAARAGVGVAPVASHSSAGAQPTGTGAPAVSTGGGAVPTVPGEDETPRRNGKAAPPGVGRPDTPGHSTEPGPGRSDAAPSPGPNAPVAGAGDPGDLVATPAATPQDPPGQSESTPPPAEQTPPTSGGTDASRACPGGGNGPGNGSGCGLAKGHEPPPAEEPGSTGGATNTGSSVGDDAGAATTGTNGNSAGKPANTK